MQFVVDNKIIQLLISESPLLLNNPNLSPTSHLLALKWPSLFTYLGLETLFAALPVFGPSQVIFEACVTILKDNQEKDVFYMYDRLFTEKVREIQALPQIQAPFLLQKLQEQRKQLPSLEALLDTTLDSYEAAFAAHASWTMHDLILYLAWDRMCLCVARLLDYQLEEPRFIKNLQVLKECLVESYQHITQQGRTQPGIFRMLEALLFYQMREENIEKHTDDQWTILIQSLSLLPPQEMLADFFYIDDAIGSFNLTNSKPTVQYLTCDARCNVERRCIFVQYMLEQLKRDTPSWSYTWQSREIIYLS